MEHHEHARRWTFVCHERRQHAERSPHAPVHAADGLHRRHTTRSTKMRIARARLQHFLLLTVTWPLVSSAFTIGSLRSSSLSAAATRGMGTGWRPVERTLEMSATQATAQQAQALKRTIVDTASGTSNGLNASPQQRDKIAKAVNALVALNPTEDLATSAAATGTWTLVYTTTSGASGGKLGPFVGEVQQEVDIAEGRYENYVRLGPLTGGLDATWEIVNKQQWNVIFKTIAFSLGGFQLFKRDLEQRGLWTLSYLDEDMRILTARSLDRDKGNLYVLTRA